MIQKYLRGEYDDSKKGLLPDYDSKAFETEVNRLRKTISESYEPRMERLKKNFKTRLDVSTGYDIIFVFTHNLLADSISRGEEKPGFRAAIKTYGDAAAYIACRLSGKDISQDDIRKAGGSTRHPLEKAYSHILESIDGKFF